MAKTPRAKLHSPAENTPPTGFVPDNDALSPADEAALDAAWAKVRAEPQFATQEDIKHLEELAKFWDNPEVKRLLAEREQQETKAKGE